MVMDGGVEAVKVRMDVVHLTFRTEPSAQLRSELKLPCSEIKLICFYPNNDYMDEVEKKVNPGSFLSENIFPFWIMSTWK